MGFATMSCIFCCPDEKGECPRKSHVDSARTLSGGLFVPHNFWTHMTWSASASSWGAPSGRGCQ